MRRREVRGAAAFTSSARKQQLKKHVAVVPEANSERLRWRCGTNKDKRRVTYKILIKFNLGSCIYIVVRLIAT
jgi:hypothetical protein